MLIGDSLANSAREFFSQAIAADENAVVDADLVLGGTAICDWLPTLGEAIRTFAPHVAVMEFSGNSITSCMREPTTRKPLQGSAWLEKYRADAAAASAIFARFGVEVYWVGAPVTRDDQRGRQDRLNKMYERLAERSTDAHYVYAGAAVLNDGQYTDYLPCESGEPCTDIDPATGRRAARVRSHDGGHFCPDDIPAVWGVTQPCTVWSSGAWRFGRAMAAPVIERFDL